MLENYQSPWMDEELVIMRDAVRKFLDKEFVPLAKSGTSRVCRPGRLVQSR